MIDETELYLIANQMVNDGRAEFMGDSYKIYEYVINIEDKEYRVLYEENGEFPLEVTEIDG